MDGGYGSEDWLSVDRGPDGVGTVEVFDSELFAGEDCEGMAESFLLVWFLAGLGVMEWMRFESVIEWGEERGLLIQVSLVG